MPRKSARAKYAAARKRDASGHFLPVPGAKRPRRAKMRRAPKASMASALDTASAGELMRAAVVLGKVPDGALAPDDDPRQNPDDFAPRPAPPIPDPRAVVAALFEAHGVAGGVQAMRDVLRDLGDNAPRGAFGHAQANLDAASHHVGVALRQLAR